jgi:serine/threonine-protein kinase
MGEVYLAEDTRLGRKVALKRPAQSWLRDPDARLRLQREARAAARLNNPRIAAVYDVLELDEQPYIVMEYVEGESLASRLRRGPFPLERAIALGIDLADALAVAHDGGVIHRDLKPGNIILSESGALKILDFGLAKTAPVLDETRDHDSLITAPGQILGTPGYVAPEQLLGRPAGVRSDIYSAGAIFYEMITGKAPFDQADSMGRALASLMAGVAPAHEVNPAIPREVSDIASKAMARDPNDRFASASDFKDALVRASSQIGESPTHLLGTTRPSPRRAREWWQIAMAVAILVAVAGIPISQWWRSYRSERNTASRAPVVAVMPFDAPASSLDGIGPGLADTISTTLAALAANAIVVVGRSEVNDAIKRNPDHAKLARSLAASHIITGRVQQFGEKLQINVNVVQDGKIAWGQTYDGEVANVFPLQRRIAEEVTARLVGRMSSSARDPFARAPAPSVQAISAYWRGRELLERADINTVDAAIKAFEEATTADPAFALGFAGLGDAHWRKYLLSKDASFAHNAVVATERARQLDPDEPRVRYSLATIYRGMGRTKEAVDQLQQMLELQPVSEDAHRLLGDIHAEAGRFDEAVASFDAALRIRPNFWGTYRSLAITLNAAGRYDQALEAADKIIELQPESPLGYQIRGNILAYQGEWQAAEKSFQEAIARGGSPATHSSLGSTFYYQGRFAEAAQSFERAVQLRPGNAVTRMNLADAYKSLGRREDARREYERAADLFAGELAVNPKNAETLALRAVCQAEVGRAAAARADMKTAMGLNPESPDVHYARTVLLVALNDLDAALASLDKAVELGFSPALARSDDRLRPLHRYERFRDAVDLPRPGR